VTLFGDSPIAPVAPAGTEAVHSAAWYVCRTVTGMLIAGFALGLETLWASLACTFVAVLSRLRYIPAHAMLFGERFTLSPVLELVPLTMIIVLVYHINSYARQAFVALVHIQVARASRIEQLKAEKERLDLERAMLASSIQRTKAWGHEGAPNGSVVSGAVSEARWSTTTSERGREWLEEWQATREKELHDARLAELEAELAAEIARSHQRKLAEWRREVQALDPLYSRDRGDAPAMLPSGDGVSVLACEAAAPISPPSTSTTAATAATAAWCAKAYSGPPPELGEAPLQPAASPTSRAKPNPKDE
jgi:hypothetical protein